MKLGEYIKDFREKMGWSQREFARRSGLSNTYISLLEKGGINPKTKETIAPDMATLHSLATTMGTTIHDLMSEVDDFYVDISSGGNLLFRENADTYLTPDTKPEILQIFESLPEDGKQYLLQQARIAQQIYGGVKNAKA